jgi:hypothetical protein
MMLLLVTLIRLLALPNLSASMEIPKDRFQMLLNSVLLAIGNTHNTSLFVKWKRLNKHAILVIKVDVNGLKNQNLLRNLVNLGKNLLN